MKQLQDQRRYWRDKQFDLLMMEANHVHYAYPRHSHHQYVICVVDRGLQSFTHKGTKYYTPPNGLILINPDIVHTGEPAIEQGFHIRSIYPTFEQLKTVYVEMTGKNQGAPFFRDVRIDDVETAQRILKLHHTLSSEADPLECESVYLSTMAYLIQSYAEARVPLQSLGDEREAVRKARAYIEANFAESLELAEIAEHVSLSSYYFLRVFAKEVGMPPHAYLQNVRVQQAQRLIEGGTTLSDVAVSVGFSHQSHLNRRFKQYIGMTPGEYAFQMRGA